jgi:D-alanyl-D-alanine carboxypeptidase/D-alanyl-D-alanine-endopeptidase (penicillin-binding protein 4)
VSEVTRRFAAGAAGAVAAVVAFAAVSVSTGAGAEPARASAPGDLAARFPGAVVPSASPSAVLPGVGEDAPVPLGARLDALLTPLLGQDALGGAVSMDVVDVLTGDHLTRLGHDAPRTPASTAKLLTAAAALSRLKPETTLPTRVVRGATTGEVVLVGGGDILLGAGKGRDDLVDGHAGLADLARLTAAALKQSGTSRVTLRLDDTLFTGPTVSPRWRNTDVGNGFVAPVQALAVDAGRTRSGKYAPRVADPAMSAAQQFADRLRSAGVDVRGGVTRAAAPDGAEVLGEVRSAAVGDIVEYALTESDNTVSEVLARLVAVDAGAPASFAGAGPAVVSTVADLGVPTTGAVLSDGSGLADGSRVAPVTLTGILAAASSAERPELRPLLSGLPVAGVSGTLADRFDLRSQQPAAGVVRAKTGTLSGVSSLAGTVVDDDGRLLAFAVLADRVGGSEPAQRALDALATTLAECGCR